MDEQDQANGRMSGLPQLRVERLLWNLNVNVADYAHPAWLRSLVGSVDARRMPNNAARSAFLIERYQLDFVTSRHLDDGLARIALLDAADLHRLARLGAAIASREAIRLCVFGNDMRNCSRALGRQVLDRVMTLERDIDLTLFDRLDLQCDTQRLPFRLLKAQRRLIHALCDGLPPAAAQRARLRFRPRYFDGVAPLGDARPLMHALLGMRRYADLSERATCILG
ncbi:SctK family type III secretion system sorting platform protein [Burkholderia ambifaria]|uniref:Uncharacterized protein n=1 Tax=Burkholderia ambifaria MEX-5 TaxID=396597 RepID=B1T6T4_9BURK|nr:SctK family type III secretion system sorting platform protein [Burkholderia ambifaria]EDT40727.1 hypothetical protein BamMEX5DRAFT_3500 [Burkholderia ambifaria MEX-5]